MTGAQRGAIVTPAAGLMIYNTTSNKFNFYDGSAWTVLISANGNFPSTIEDADNDTKIEVEQAADEDIIRFTVSATEVLRIQGAMIEPMNNGSSVFIGGGAGANDDLTANQNVFVGYNSGNANTIGNSNTATGYFSLGVNTSGNQNTASGYRSLVLNSTGSQNSAYGSSALTSNTSGGSNTAVGFSAMNTNTTGNSNSAFGYGALYFNTIGFFNAASGMYALYNNTEGSYNTAHGKNALLSNVVGSKATAMGYQAMMYANSTTTAFTNYNVAVGYEALRGSTTAANNTGNYNTSVGYESTWSMTSGSKNVAHGHQALYFNTTGAQNTGVGYSAGQTNTTGSDNTFLGHNSNVSVNNLTNATAIGANTIVSQSNSLILGNGADVGIGTSTPFEKLHLENGAFMMTTVTPPATVTDRLYNTGGNLFWNGTQLDAAGGSSSWTSLSGDVFLTTLTDFVGIGTNAPSEKLSIGASGTATSTGTQANSDRIALTGSFWSGGGEILHDITFENVASTTINEEGHLSIGWNGTELMGIHSNGNVGIGTTTPWQELEIIGDIAIGYSDSYYTGAYTALGWNAGTGSIRVGANGSQGLEFYAGSTTPRMTLDDSNGNLGIGTTTPVNLLHLDGQTGTPYIRITDDITGVTSSDGLQMGTNGAGQAYIIHQETAYDLHIGTPGDNNLITLDGGTDKIGIGLTNPQGKLDIQTDGSLLGGLQLNATTAATVGAAIYFDAASVDWTMTATNSSSGAGTDKLVFRNYTGATDILTLESNGDVGIGTTTPWQELEVVGDIAIGYSDSYYTGAYTALGWNSGTGSIRVGANGTQGLEFYAGPATVRMTLDDSNGNFGIGTTSPSAKLDVVGDVEVPAANDYTYATAKTQYYTVSNAAFHKTNTGNVFEEARTSNTVYLGASGGSYGTAAQFIAPINLPDGAVITQLKAHFYRDNTNYDGSISLYRIHTGTVSSSNVATVGTAALAAGAVYPTLALSEVVNNTAYAYHLTFDTVENTFSTNRVLFYTIEIKYTVTKVE
ncbi:MAG: hypothetical protein JKY53_00345 [Flavobacteriales bacterium]|nr:hypothetical protein [Flavobacteriales bacterium]